MAQSNPLGALAAFASSATWAYSSTRYAVAAHESSPLRVNFMRMAVSWPVWVAVWFVFARHTPAPEPRQMVWLVASIFGSYALADSLFLAAARRIGVSAALAIASTYPLWAALKGTFIDGERFGPGRAIGTLLCVGGVTAIIRLGDVARREHGEPGGDRLGVPLALATSVLWACNTIGIKAGSVGLSVLTVNAVRYGVALLVLGTAVALRREPAPTRPRNGWLPMVPAIVADCMFGSTFFIYGLSHTDLAIGATLTSLAPLLSLPIALWLGVERLSLGKLAAVATTVGGVALLAAS